MQEIDYKYKQKFPKSFSLVLLIFSIVFVIASEYQIWPQLDRTVFLSKIFHDGILHPAFFSIFQLLIIILSLYLIKKSGLRLIRPCNKELYLYLSTIIYFLFIMINPNNHTDNPILGLPLLSEISYYTHFLFLAAFLFIKKDIFIIFVGKFIKIIMIVSIIWAAILFILWLFGKGNYSLFGIRSVLTEEDTLFIFSFVQLIFLLQYYLYKRIRYLIIWGFLMFFLILSFRRSCVMISFLTSFSLIILYNISIKHKLNKIVVFFMSFFLLVFLVIPFIATSFNVDIYVSRYIGEYISIPGIDFNEDVSRNKHIEQANYGLSLMIKRLSFWGNGLGSSYTKYDYGNTGIHNAYFQIWDQYGFVPLLYYLGIILLLIIETIKILINKRMYDRQYFLLKSSILIYLIFFFINAWVLIYDNFIDIRMVFLRGLLLAFLLRVDNRNYKLLVSLKTTKGVNNAANHYIQ